MCVLMEYMHMTSVFLCAFCLLTVAVTDNTDKCKIFSVKLPICTVATAVKAMCQYCCTVTVCHSNTHCHYISAYCYQYVR